MSLPPSAAHTGSVTLIDTTSTGANTPGYPKTSDVPDVVTCRGVQPVKTKTPFRYRIKVWTYKGRVYSRVKGYHPKSIRFGPNTWRPPHPYVGSFTQGDVTHFNGTVGICNTTFPKETSISVGDLPCANYGLNCPAIPPARAGIENEAVIKALNRLKSQSVNLAVAFAERAETAELLVGTLAGLSKAMRSLRRGDMRGVATGLGLTHAPKKPGGNLSLSQKWLELQYGWQPLYQDVYGCVQALHARDQDDPARYTVTAKGKVKYPFETNDHLKATGTKPGWGSRSSGFEGGFCRLDFYLQNPLLASLAALGITNPLEVAWERVPFSFAVDWFYPVGRYLSALDATLGYQFRGGSFTWLFRREFSAWLTPGIPGGNITPLFASGSANVTQVSINRKTYGTSPLPRVPSFKNPFPKNGIHIANAIALFASSMRLF